MPAEPSPDRVPADPTKWSAKSQGSPPAFWTTEYTDIQYDCWHCQKTATFSAADQRYTYEVKKATINQHRILCEPCWRESLRIAAELAEHQSWWAQSKSSLRSDRPFLTRWLELLELREKYVPYWRDIARKNMLRKLLGTA